MVFLGFLDKTYLLEFNSLQEITHTLVSYELCTISYTFAVKLLSHLYRLVLNLNKLYQSYLKLWPAMEKTSPHLSMAFTAGLVSKAPG